MADCHPDLPNKAHGLCRNCYDKKRKRNLYEADPKHFYEQNVRWRKRNPEAYLLRTAKCRAKKRVLEFTITVKDIHIPKACPILGIPLVPSYGKQHTDASPTLDRIDPSGGYVPDNVAVISHKANMLKSFGTIEEHEKIAAWMRQKLRD